MEITFQGQIAHDIGKMDLSADELLGDKRALPMLRDVLYAGLVQCADDDILLFTNDDVFITSEAFRQLRLKLRFVNAVTAAHPFMEETQQEISVE